MTFSGALTLTDLNDYITPSQACIKPLEQSNAPNPRTPGDAATEIRIDASGAYYELGQGSGGSSGGTQKLQTAEISLTDCLACSGCITSAESVLITLQSHTEVLSVLAANPSPGSPGHRIPVLSIAPQSLASLAAALAPSSSHSGTTTPTIPLVHMLNRVQAFATRTLGFAHVFDTTFAREIVLREHVREFSERKERAAAASGSGSSGALPMLSSACPGWVCYAEKTHGEMLPFIAATKSPQQVMGTLVKEWLAPHYWDKRPDEVYHVTVMPCYDKKLEASRSDFYNEQYATRDVDCVITTGELLLLAQEHGIDLSLPVPNEDVSPSPTSTSATPVLPVLLSHPGSSSGSYLHSLMLAVARTYPNPLTQESKTVRSADYVEHTLRDASSGSPVFRGATCYGFRNLQNVVRRVGRATGVQVGRGAAGRLAGGLRNNRSGDGTAYDYVEVMACPGGCVGGGGQLRAPEKKAASSSSSNNGANHDAEGFVRDWAADGVVRPTDDANNGSSSQSQEGSNNKSRHTGTAELEAPWSSRAWTREVERVYWGAGNDRLAALAAGPEKPIPKHALAQVRVPQAQEQALLALALPTPPASPKPPRGSGGVDGGEGCASAEGSRAYGQGHGDHGAKESRGGGATVVSHQRPSSFGMDAARVHAEQRELESECVDMDVDVVVDLLVERVLRELCAAPGRRQQQEDEIVVGVGSTTAGAGQMPEGTCVDEMAEMRRRRELFRTEYRVVESEIIGLGVKW